MKSRLIEELTPQVKENCIISDARYWGFYSICGLLLRLRELYRFESGLEPWDASAEGDISNWIGQREARWEELAEAEFTPLSIGTEQFAPFEVDRINRRLNECGLVYGAGYGLYGKPVFFLAELDSRRVMDGYDILISAREYARDLSIHPAMLQHRSIYARKDICALLLWEKFEEFRAKQTASALSLAFSHYGINAKEDAADIKELIKKAADSELGTYIHHELGEAIESEKAGPAWTEMLSAVLSSKASMFARSVMDTMADTSDHGMLNHIILTRNTGSLAFYMTFLGGYRRIITEDIVRAFRKFSEDEDWRCIEQARASIYKRAEHIAKNILQVYSESKEPQALIDCIQREITLLQP